MITIATTLVFAGLTVGMGLWLMMRNDHRTPTWAETPSGRNRYISEMNRKSLEKRDKYFRENKRK